MQLELMVRPAAQVVKNAARNEIQEAAKEKWRADYRELAKHPERLPVRTKLWEEAQGISGLTRQMFRDVISDEGPGRSGPRLGIRAKKPEKNGANCA
jgi:phytoene/squalene synthetase